MRSQIKELEIEGETPLVLQPTEFPCIDIRSFRRSTHCGNPRQLGSKG